MTILCIQNEIVQVKIVWDFSMLLYEEVSRVLPNKIQIKFINNEY